MNWDNRIIIATCGGENCNTSVKVTTQQQSDAIIALGKGPLCPACLQRVRDSFTVVEVERVAW